jgi:hypothetical protein
MKVKMADRIEELIIALREKNKGVKEEDVLFRGVVSESPSHALAVSAHMGII